jgi:catechol 2,3-dioxygenase-like lactoylglutathione lyase family enzyme
MMYLEHVNLVVKDIPTSLTFYQAAFPEWQIRGGGESDWFGKPRTWLHFGNHLQYIALSDHGEGSNRELKGHQVGFAHFAYVVNNLAAVINRLHIAGFEVAKPGSPTAHRDNVYFVDPDGFEVEFVQYHSDLVEQRNQYL